MISRLFTERARYNLVQTRRTVQVLTWAAGFAILLVVMFADPGHRLALGAINTVFHLINLVIR